MDERVVRKGRPKGTAKGNVLADVSKGATVLDMKKRIQVEKKKN